MTNSYEMCIERFTHELGIILSFFVLSVGFIWRIYFNPAITVCQMGP